MTPTRARQALGIAAGCAIVAQHPAVTTAATQRVAALAVAVAATAALGAATLTGRWAPRAAPGAPALAFAAFAAFTAGSLAWGSPAGIELVTTLGAASLLGLVAAALRTPAPRPRDDARSLAPATLAALVAGAVTATRVGVDLARGERGAALDGGQGNANWAGLLLGLALLPVIELALERRRWARAGAATAAIGIAAAGAVVESRAAFVGLGAGLTLALVTAWTGRRSANPAGGARAALITAAPFAGGLGLTALALAVGPRVVAGAGGAGAALAGRAWIWRVSADVAAASLPLGTGAGAFTAEYLPAQARRLAGLPLAEAARRAHDVVDAHHDWLAVLAVLGPVGVALLGAALAAGVAAAVRARRPLQVGALAFAVVAMSGDVLVERPGVALLLALLLADAGGPAPAGERVRRGPRASLRAAFRTPWPWLGALALSALLLRHATTAWLAEHDLARADAAGPRARRARLERAWTRNPRSPVLAIDLGVARLQDGDATGAERVLATAVALRPSVGGLVALGNARRELGEPAAARRTYERAVALAPTSFRARVSLSSALIAAGDLDGADRHLTVARALYPGDPRVGELTERLRRAQLARATGG